MGAWTQDQDYNGYDVWEATGEDWPSAVTRCECGSRVHWITRRVVEFKDETGQLVRCEQLGGKNAAYRYNVIHGPKVKAAKPEIYPRPEVADHKRRASGEAA